ncbi:uncharacterized protein LOC112602188 [Melanaphis sacchari]|uniref:uncharacterized protein LOC112602188 n=1 Tax=Melanaphis sacchari TaxID=742174 RepID=UPI000DC15780|nr:uncharacterized protein LOC112602188 [Melanaphis sacchari]
MIVNSSVALFVIAMFFQHSHCKPTHRFIRENNNEGEPRINKIKEFLSQIPGYGSFGSTSQSESSSTSNQPDSSTSYQEETAAGPEPAETEVQSSIVARDGSASSTGFPSYTNYMPSQFSQYQNQVSQSINPGQYLNYNSAGASGTN